MKNYDLIEILYPIGSRSIVLINHRDLSLRSIKNDSEGKEEFVPNYLKENGFVIIGKSHSFHGGDIYIIEQKSLKS